MDFSFCLNWPWSFLLTVCWGVEGTDSARAWMELMEEVGWATGGSEEYTTWELGKELCASNSENEGRRF